MGLIALFTSMLAAIIGFGGGMILIAILPAFLSPSLIIPFHGLVQLTSNSTRMLFSLKSVRWELFSRFLVGSIIGTLVIGYGISNMSMEFVPLAIGFYILLNLWSPRFSTSISRYESYFLIGFIQTGLGLIVGATGPLSLSILTKQLKSKDEIIATSSMFMTISHLAKIPVYLSITVNLFSDLSLIFNMVVGAILGSFLGTKLRLSANNGYIIRIIKILLTLLAVKMIVKVVLQHSV